MKNIPTFLEIVTNDLAEYKVTYPRIIYLYQKFTRDLVLKKAAGMVFLTSETANNYIVYKKPYTIIGDSIDFSQYPVYRAPFNKTPRLVFIGVGVSPWFGIDKVLLMAKMLPDWLFDIIGVSESELTEKIPKNVLAHGRLTRKEYEKIMIRADIGVGTLALYRINMNESTPLKVREYLAYGIPTIIGYRDPDLSQDLPFVLTLPNSDNNVQDKIDEIKSFVEKWKGKRVPRSVISYLGLDIKENQRLEFIMKHR